eukprot:TRINITY_DN39729_c0_g1_i2.p1 TRINITY_DN39729_c0_g1~~TRINITY_DN39729_c0_g1_i2.p1  ORF type:complete len:230 (-),score=84.31 TRINITY_DN39729_c0_g1_i2:223-912(-)
MCPVVSLEVLDLSPSSSFCVLTMVSLSFRQLLSELASKHEELQRQNAWLLSEREGYLCYADGLKRNVHKGECVIASDTNNSLFGELRPPDPKIDKLGVLASASAVTDIPGDRAYVDDHSLRDSSTSSADVPTTAQSQADARAVPEEHRIRTNVIGASVIVRGATGQNSDQFGRTGAEGEWQKRKQQQQEEQQQQKQQQQQQKQQLKQQQQKQQQQQQKQQLKQQQQKQH